MSLQRLQIFFDNPYATYYCGQTVTGHIAVSLTKEKKLRAIEVSILGRAKVKWTEGSGRNRHVYRAKEIYIKNDLLVLGKSDGEMKLPPGDHHFRFAFLVPNAVPSSFEGKKGYVRYTIKCTIIRPWRFNHECIAAFTVLNVLDLNTFNVQDSVTASVDKSLCCWCCTSQPITIVVKLPFTGFVPGQQCEALVEVDNRTDTAFPITCSLVQIVDYTGYGTFNVKRHKIIRNVITKVSLGDVKKKETKTFPTSVYVPALPASLLCCSIIEVTYAYEVAGEVPGFHLNAIAAVPLVLGNVPLRNQFQSLIPVEAAVASTSGHNSGYSITEPGETVAQDILSVPPGIDYPEMLPPSYEECVSGKTNIRSENDSKYLQGNMDFAPRYPIYHFK